MLITSLSLYFSPINAHINVDGNAINWTNNKAIITELDSNPKFKAKVEKSLFAGKEFKITANVAGESWSFFNEDPIDIGKNIYLNFEKKDLLEFDSTCSNFFTH